MFIGRSTAKFYADKRIEDQRPLGHQTFDAKGLLRLFSLA